MIDRIRLEEREHLFLSEYACKADESKGRMIEEPQDAMRTDFQRDRDRIIHSKSFRRLMHKTQVFLAPEGDHFRTRLTHTLEVSQIARTISRGIGLNEDLTEAIALGHDLGHTPFGHNGEMILNRIHVSGFQHNEQSLRVVDVLEMHNGRRGMNLTAEVRDGILNHTGPVLPFTLEGQVVKISDRIAYINHDIDDAIRSGVISLSDLPKDCVRVLGQTHGERIDCLVADMIRESVSKDRIHQSDEIAGYMNELRSFMFKNVYHNDKVKKTEELMRIEQVLEMLYDYYMNHPELLPEELRDFSIEEAVKDYIAGMTDRYCMLQFNELFMPAGVR